MVVRASSSKDFVYLFKKISLSFVPLGLLLFPILEAICRDEIVTSSSSSDLVLILWTLVTRNCYNLFA